LLYYVFSVFWLNVTMYSLVNYCPCILTLLYISDMYLLVATTSIQKRHKYQRNYGLQVFKNTFIKTSKK